MAPGQAEPGLLLFFCLKAEQGEFRTGTEEMRSLLCQEALGEVCV